MRGTRSDSFSEVLKNTVPNHQKFWTPVPATSVGGHYNILLFPFIYTPQYILTVDCGAPRRPNIWVGGDHSCKRMRVTPAPRSVT